MFPLQNSFQSECEYTAINMHFRKIFYLPIHWMDHFENPLVHSKNTQNANYWNEFFVIYWKFIRELDEPVRTSPYLTICFRFDGPYFRKGSKVLFEVECLSACTWWRYNGAISVVHSFINRFTFFFKSENDAKTLNWNY